MSKTTSIVAPKTEPFPDLVYVEYTATPFDTEITLFPKLLKEITNAPDLTVLTYFAMDADVGAQLIDSLAREEVVERRHVRYATSYYPTLSPLANNKHMLNFNSVSHTLWIAIMATPLHGCFSAWMSDQVDDWRTYESMTKIEKRKLKVEGNILDKTFSPPYQSSRKSADYQIRPNNDILPSFVIESGWSETYTKLKDDMRLWLVGGRTTVNVVLLLNWTKKANTNQVKGVAEIWIRDAAGNPYLRQKETVFPHNRARNLQITWGELFGRHLMPGRNGQAYLPLDINSLRLEARDAMDRMGLVPAS